MKERNRNTAFIDRNNWAPLIIYDESVTWSRQPSTLFQPARQRVSIDSTYHSCHGFQFCAWTKCNGREEFVEFPVIVIGFPVAAQLLQGSREWFQRHLLDVRSITWMRFSFCSRRLYFRWSKVSSDFNFESPGKLEFGWLTGTKLVFSCFCSIFFRSLKRTRQALPSPLLQSQDCLLLEWSF